MGDNDAWIIEQAEQQGLPLPDRIKNAPSLSPGLELYLTAFHRLSTCRQMGMGVGPIPYLAIGQYADQEEFDRDHRYELYCFIEHLDAAYLNWAAKKNNVGKD